MKHAFVSSKSAATDQTLVDGPRWNALHVLGISSISANATLDLTYDFVRATGGSSGITLSLPTASGNAGAVLKVMKVDAGVGAVTLAPFGSEVINADASYILSNKFQFVEITSDGTNWLVIDNN